jgi:hypothetical protein
MISLPVSKPITIVLLGADRVGKSTIIHNTKERLQQQNLDAAILHFSGAKPFHSNPIEQYILPFDANRETMADYILCDRGFSEVCFYDDFRRRITISHEWAQAAESYFLENSFQVKVFLLEREWEWSQPHHLAEVQNEEPNATAWWIKSQMKAREAEHHAYYDYMHAYLNHYSLLPHTVLRDTPIDFDLLDWRDSV